MSQETQENPVVSIDFDQTLNDFAGIPLKIDGAVVTLREVATRALLTVGTGTTDSKAACYALAKRIYAGQTLSTREISDIRSYIGQAFIPMICGPAIEIIDQAVQS